MRAALALGLVFGAVAAAAVAQPLSQSRAELLPEAPGKLAVVRTCTLCHDATEITTRRMSRNAWDIIIDKMIGLGAEAPDEDRAAILDYLAANFSPAPTAAPAQAPPSGEAAPASPAATNAPG